MVVEMSEGLAGVKRHDYLPFGGDIPVVPGGRSIQQGYSDTDNVKQKFTGYERDAETSLDYAENRYYSLMQGRFTSTDEFKGGPSELWVLGSGSPEKQALVYADVTNPQSLNKYQYSYNNPLRYVDPSGQKPQDGLEARLRADERALAEGKITPEEFRDRQIVRGMGGLVGATVVLTVIYGPEAVTGFLLWASRNPEKVEEFAMAAQEMAGGPPSTPRLTVSLNKRLSSQELNTGTRLASQLGRDLAESPHIGAEFVDVAKKSYDAMGGPNAYSNFSTGSKFFNSILRHVNKSVDYVAIDLQGASQQQIEAIQHYVTNNLTAAQQAKIIYVLP